MGCVSWDMACQAHGVPTLHGADKAAAYPAFGVGLCVSGRRQVSSQCPQESTEKDWRSWKYSELYCGIEHEELGGSLDTLKSCCREKRAWCTPSFHCG